MRTTPVVAFFVSTIAIVAAQNASAQTTKTYPPTAGSTLGADLLLVNGTWAGDGIGVQGNYDQVISKNAGPGHVTAGGLLLLAITDDDDYDGPCDREETILGGAARVKYVLDVHPVFRPWGGAGLGIYSVDRDDDPCSGNDDDDDLGIGIPISIGLDFTLDALTLGLNVTLHQTSADEDFSALGLGAAWRF